MKRLVLCLAVMLIACVFSFNARAYDYGFVLSCGMDFTYHSPVELTEAQRREILMRLDKTFCSEEVEAPGEN